MNALVTTSMRRRASSGFTIIEMVVVLIVVGVVITLAVAPAMRGMVERHRVEGIHAELLTDLRRAQSEAAQRVGTSTSVAVSFGSNADLTCYTLHAVETGVVCDCTRAPGSACLPALDPPAEIKSMQFTRAAGVSVAASSPSGMRIQFDPPRGLATPGDLSIEVQGSLSGQLRTSVSGLGVPRVCSPDGSIRGVASC